MSENIKEENDNSGTRSMSNGLLSSIPNLPQRQDSLFDQLNDLFAVANRLGMYDAADILKPALEKYGKHEFEGYMDDMKAFTETITEIRKKHGLTKDNEFRPDKGIRGKMGCLKCGGNLHYSVASVNGHIWGKCETENCMSWMM